jgi:hypothetical protein
MMISPAITQSYIRAFPIDNKRRENSRLDASISERDKEKTKPEEEEKRPKDLAVA